MDLDVVAFPALIVADDGWVDYLESEQELSSWRQAAIAKYCNRKVLLYDSRNQAWEIETIAPLNRGNGIKQVSARLFNFKVPVQITVRPILDAPLQATRSALVIAIDADDEILTQRADSAELKDAIRKTQSFDGLVNVLREKCAI